MYTPQYFWLKSSNKDDLNNQDSDYDDSVVMMAGVSQQQQG